MQVSSTKMPPQPHFISFNDTKSKHFSNLLKDSSVYIYNVSCIRQPVAQELDKIHVLVCMRASFVDLFGSRCLRAGSPNYGPRPHPALETLSSSCKDILWIMQRCLQKICDLLHCNISRNIGKMSGPRTFVQELMWISDKKVWLPLSWSKVANRLRLNVCWCTVYRRRANIKSAITMTTTMTPCSGAILAGNSILQIMHWKYRDFRNAFARKFYEQMVVSFQVETCKFTKNKLLKLVNSMKWVSLFAGSNLNSIVVKKKFQNAAF